ncbi:zincin-like metallopeptidase domain-containing protein [Algoriphagus sp. D3-2-R+10]|uniref:ArdC family protein n=1 Tax=Algoriphagus aurantiacus TaxID=3103948 RepID=UPI002B36DC59|nr:zincin-like metallopeptidase domain-containing protein [Algoriphagus sp. D3-2-R+10]MEB2774616.1 zincin-like metallopeptidase domain-containing protein [Algoriphagus sp. D3-2-R+10]
MKAWENFNKLAETVTNEIIEGIQNENLTWEKVWSPKNAPKNYASDRPYLGFNSLWLSWVTISKKFTSPYFLTYKQAKQMGGNVKKEERGTKVVFWKISKFVKGKTTNEEGEHENVFGRKFTPFIWTVFNIDQIEGIDFSIENTEEERIFSPIETCEAIISGYRDCPNILYQGAEPYYSPLNDYINMPEKEAFQGNEQFYSVLFHEICHSTGHESRLGRFSDRPVLVGYQSAEYSKEELVAEMGASFLNAYAGIKEANFKNSLAYLKGWLKPLKDDPKMLIYAAQKAHQAANYILGIDYKGEE